MIRQIAPQFFAEDIPATLAYYKEKLGFECLGTWQDPPVYAIVAPLRHCQGDATRRGRGIKKTRNGDINASRNRKVVAR